LFYRPAEALSSPLLDTPQASLIDLPRMYTDERFRSRIVARVSDPVVARFWVREYASYDRHFQAEAAAPNVLPDCA
jgi:hypothetical protein